MIFLILSIMIRNSSCFVPRSSTIIINNNNRNPQQLLLPTSSHHYFHQYHYEKRRPRLKSLFPIFSESSPTSITTSTMKTKTVAAASTTQTKTWNNMEELQKDSKRSWMSFWNLDDLDYYFKKFVRRNEFWKIVGGGICVGVVLTSGFSYYVTNMNMNEDNNYSQGMVTAMITLLMVTVSIISYRFGQQSVPSSSISVKGGNIDDEQFSVGQYSTEMSTTILNPPSLSLRIDESINDSQRTLKNDDDAIEMDNNTNKRQTISSQDNSSTKNLNTLKGNTRNRTKPTPTTTPIPTANDPITLQPIAKLSSVYRLCVGTPRQGNLVPNSRGRIDFFPQRISSDSIIGLNQYSHLWVFFYFHYNTKTSRQNKDRQCLAKIAPPALGGKKVGIFATRSPHRPNPVGFTLVKIDSIIQHSSNDLLLRKKGGKNKVPSYSVHISGLDLVDGTPVLDIKPFVPHYDTVGYRIPTKVVTSTTIASNEDELQQQKIKRQNHNHNNNNNNNDDEVKIPPWVVDGLSKRRPVSMTNEAEQQLERIMKKQSTNNNNNTASNESNILCFYGTHTGRDETEEDALTSIKSCIMETLSVDVRSAWQTRKSRKGKSQAERAEPLRKMKKSTKTASATATEEATATITTGEEENEEESDISSSSSIVKNNKVCTQQIDNLLISFIVKNNNQQSISFSPKSNSNSSDKLLSINTDGSGADDIIVVVGIEEI